MEVYDLMMNLAEGAEDVVLVILSFLKYLEVVGTGDVALVHRSLRIMPARYVDWGLKEAVHQGNVPLTQYLLDNTLHLMERAADTLTYALVTSAELGRADLVALLADKGAVMQPGKDFHDAYLTGINGQANVTVIQELERFYPVPAQWIDLYCYCSIYKNKVELVEFFLERGAELPELLVPELVANFSVPMLRLLVDKRAFFLVEETIMAAIEQDRVEIVFWLNQNVKHYCKVEDQLIFALERKCKRCVRWLVVAQRVSYKQVFARAIRLRYEVAAARIIQLAYNKGRAIQMKKTRKRWLNRLY